MIESCSTRRMLILIGFLLAASCLIVVFENYVEENEFDADLIIAAIQKHRTGANDGGQKTQQGAPSQAQDKQKPAQKEGRVSGDAKIPSDIDKEAVKLNCGDSSTLRLVSECVQCSDFEIKGLKTSYCKPTGFYDKFLCGADDKAIFLPCRGKRIPTGANFAYFAAISIVASAGFTSFVSWRRTVVEHRTYARLQSFIT